MAASADSPFETQPSSKPCPKCGEPLQIKSSGSGPFWACSTYPKCDFTQSMSSHNEVSIIKILDDVCCPECESDLAVKSGKYGMFIGCTNYPTCKFKVKEEDDDDYEPVPCPSCESGELHQRASKKGKPFYACDQYPKCDFLLNDKPIAHDCPKCGGSIMVETKNNMLKCVNPNCNETTNQENDH